MQDITRAAVAALTNGDTPEFSHYEGQPTAPTPTYTTLLRELDHTQFPSALFYGFRFRPIPERVLSFQVRSEAFARAVAERGAR